MIALKTITIKDNLFIFNHTDQISHNFNNNNNKIQLLPQKLESQAAAATLLNISDDCSENNHNQRQFIYIQSY